MPHSSDLTFITNEDGRNLRDRFGDAIGNDTRFFDCLVGYFFISGFYKLYPALESVEKIRILVGLQTDRTVYELLECARESGALPLQSHAAVKDQVAGQVLAELEKAPDRTEIETGVHQFIAWLCAEAAAGSQADVAVEDGAAKAGLEACGERPASRGESRCA
jgi:hypothetical protein